ncbi:hypothetical protein M422DRAFT_36288 [Sphaerobolus stellatus SS14]|uniref:Uncharacterized protein n=1 Tax=Sphaerobolus stellatus (strain SS14) TaxID=990650 RepID=A0A0C9U9Q3_SPHS4|nr:hypothetical protein M422DRAFT_36288 [Sphaerobolus stellatus SS14]
MQLLSYIIDIVQVYSAFTAIGAGAAASAAFACTARAVGSVGTSLAGAASFGAAALLALGLSSGADAVWVVVAGAGHHVRVCCSVVGGVRDSFILNCL